ncbi:MAG: TonB-dependent receptor domain-containing protein, partial [Gemmatimonadota bacterium]
DFNLSENHSASLKYNYTWSEQVNGTFDVDAWGASSNGIEKDFSHAVNGALNSQLSNTLSNEFRFQYAREDRPRSYGGPLFPGGDTPAPPQFNDLLGGKPFPDVGMDFGDGFRIGLPFFLPIDPGFDTRIQLVDNITKLSGDHLFKFGVEYNRTKVQQQFIGFSNARYIFDSVDSFIDYVETGDTDNIVLFLQSAAIPPTPQSSLGLQTFNVNELAVFFQDTWQPTPNLTLNLGLRWEGTWHPDNLIEPQNTFFATYLDDARFPSDGSIPDDLNNFQPRFGLAYDLKGDGDAVFRFNAGSYFSRIPMLVFAQHRTTNGAFQSILAASGANYDDFGGLRRPAPADGHSFPDGHSGRLQGSSATQDLVVQRRIREAGKRQRCVRDLRPARPHRQPVPVHEQERRGARRAIWFRHAPGRRRHPCADDHGEQRPVSLQRDHDRPQGPERDRRPPDLRGQLHAVE